MPPDEKPCGGGHAQGNGGGSGIVIVLPLALGTFAAGIRARLPRAARRLARGRRTTTGS